MNFEILRDMEPFTQAMFNNIIGFQEKDHPAWNEDLDFAERIADLPLHYLIFSNPDRNPETQGPTVAHYYPLREEMLMLSRYAKAVADKPVVLDVHARNGFIGSLLAQEGLQVVGVRDENEKPNQIQNFFDKKQYRFADASLEHIDLPVDVVFSSWMPSETDISEHIIRLNPKLVVYVFTQHENDDGSIPQTGKEGAFGENLPENYRLIDEWNVTRPKNLLNEIWPDLTGNIEETRCVRILANEGYHDLTVDDNITLDELYAWEHELQMAETALEAKRQMMERGFPANF